MRYGRTFFVLSEKRPFDAALDLAFDIERLQVLEYTRELRGFADDARRHRSGRPNARR